MKFTDLKACPFCGCDIFYEKQYASGIIYYNRTFSGEEAPNDDMYDGLSFTYSGRCYCCDCNKYIGNSIKNTVGKAAREAATQREGR